jgi:hypothetical protein
VREHTEKIRPPRALWVTFELGRPMGIPGDGPFQRPVPAAPVVAVTAAIEPPPPTSDEPPLEITVPLVAPVP